MPSREESSQRTPGGGETGDGNEREIPPVAPAPNATPPRAPDAGGPGRVLARPMIFVFMGWAADGRYLGGKVFDKAEACETQREQDQARHRGVQFSHCAMLWAERETL